MTQWIEQSWMEVMASFQPTIQRVFKTTGISVAADGSEDDIIAIHGIENYTYAVFSGEEVTRRAETLIMAYQYSSL